MGHTPEDIAAWQTKLGNAFSGHQGIVGERLISLQEAEKCTQSLGIKESRVYATLLDAFFDFSIQTIDILSKPIRVYHAVRNPLFVSSVSRLRSSYCLFWMGYYFDSAALLRGVFENATHLCADARGEGSLSQWFGAGGQQLSGSIGDIKKVHDHFRKHDLAVQSLIFREKSGLSLEDQRELGLLVKLMHSHVHRTEMHLVHLILDVKKNKKPVSIFPRWDGHVSSHFIHISIFIAWMLARLMSHAVPQENRSADWANARDVLDQSLRFWFEGWDKPLAATIIRFIDAKFQFAGEWGESDS